MPFVELYVDGHRVFRGTSADAMFTVNRGGPTSDRIDRTVTTGGQTVVRFGLIPSDPRSAGDHGNIYFDATTVRVTAKWRI